MLSERGGCQQSTLNRKETKAEDEREEPEYQIEKERERCAYTGSDETEKRYDWKEDQLLISVQMYVRFLQFFFLKTLPQLFYDIILQNYYHTKFFVTA